jgi:hypothetical protein
MTTNKIKYNDYTTILNLWKLILEPDSDKTATLILLACQFTCGVRDEWKLFDV